MNRNRWTSEWTPELKANVRSAALDAGFHRFGVADAGSSEADDRFEAWIDAGRAGEMEYLKRRDASGTLLRSGLRAAIPWAHSIVICALNYDSPEPLSTDPAPPGTGWIGRYAWSGKRPEAAFGSDPARSDSASLEPLVPSDYHEELLQRLRTVETQILNAIPCQTRCYVDTGPIVERSFAARAGIGWIGKNTCVINQQLGSWLLLGVIVTSLPIAAETAMPELAADRCGSCTRCIEACPTNALVAPREMDASRCIAYLTIEKKGTIDPDLRKDIGRNVFGCDICQDVCPWNSRSRNRRSQNRRSGNRTPSIAVTAGMEPRSELINPSLAWLAEMDSRTFKRWFKGSPLERTGRKRLLRNVSIAMGNSCEPHFLPQLQQWAEGDDAVLAETARWAVERIRSASIEL